MQVRAPTAQELARLAPPNVRLRPMPLIRCINMFSENERRANIRHAFSLGLPNLQRLEKSEQGKEGVIVGGGPSIDFQADRIKSLSESGARIVSIDRMLPWCLRHSINPDYLVAVDASDDVAEAFEHPPLTTKYILSSQCHPGAFERLKDCEVYIFNAYQGTIDNQFFIDCGDMEGLEVNTGGSVVLGAMAVAMVLGLADLHLFGFDCHTSGGKYANGIAGQGGQANYIKVRIEDRDFETTQAYLGFAQQFFVMKKFGEDDGLLNSVKVYGDSLVTALAKEDLRG